MVNIEVCSETSHDAFLLFFFLHKMFSIFFVKKPQKLRNLKHWLRDESLYLVVLETEMTGFSQPKNAALRQKWERNNYGLYLRVSSRPFLPLLTAPSSWDSFIFILTSFFVQLPTTNDSATVSYSDNQGKPEVIKKLLDD